MTDPGVPKLQGMNISSQRRCMHSKEKKLTTSLSYIWATAGKKTFLAIWGGGGVFGGLWWGPYIGFKGTKVFGQSFTHPYQSTYQI